MAYQENNIINEYEYISLRRVGAMITMNIGVP